MLEVPQNSDPMEDQFAKKANIKADSVAKNEIKRMRNIVKAKKGAIPRTGYLGPDTASSSDVNVIHLINHELYISSDIPKTKKNTFILNTIAISNNNFEHEIIFMYTWKKLSINIWAKH